MPGVLRIARLAHTAQVVFFAAVTKIKLPRIIRSLCLLRFSAVRCRSITPFDEAELPTSLNSCNTPKKKETLKADAQEAIEASYLTRRVQAAVTLLMVQQSTPGIVIPVFRSYT